MKASELKEILDQHQLWFESNGVQGKCADLEDAILEGANLINAYLKDASLWRADLHAANLTRANLTRANLRGACLTDANLTSASLTDADLTGASLTDADLICANLTDANLTRANLTGANLSGANLSGAILPDISWIIPGCLVQLNQIKYSFYLYKEDKYENFVQDSFGFFIQDNVAEKTFDMLAGDRIIRNIPDWVKYSGLSKIKD